MLFANELFFLLREQHVLERNHLVVSFAIGTLLNVGSFLYLRRMRPHTALIVSYWQFCLLMQLPEGPRGERTKRRAICTDRVARP